MCRNGVAFSEEEKYRKTHDNLKRTKGKTNKDERP